jgi:hypothetical protein
MKIENTTTEEITKLLCQVMESKAGQTDGEIVDEFEKLLKQKYCTHENTRLHIDNPIANLSYGFGHEFIGGKLDIYVAEICCDCGTTIATGKWHCDVMNIE